ncbi:MAG: tetratricopeptide repeat protein [Bacteroidales bacterium]|nr:tetratricopeptide repeat protein [Bacteroidales bacterium]
MKLLKITCAFGAMLMSAFVCSASEDGLREALRLYDKGMYNRAKVLLKDLSREYEDADPKGWAVLCSVVEKTPGYESEIDRFLEECPYSPLYPQIMYRHAMNLFDSGLYRSASDYLSRVSEEKLYKSQRTEYLFRSAYCALESGDLHRAYEGFAKVESGVNTDLTAPSRYSMGYIRYVQKNFREAVKWFSKASKDSRFTDMSTWYILESEFMLKNYPYVVAEGEKFFDKVASERKPHLARLISESYLVLGDADKARRYYDYNAADKSVKNRSDWFYSGSVLYAVQDYKGAVENYEMMVMRTDSIGQIANYHLGYSYIQLKNKVAALEAFKDASAVSFDQDIAEDAFFNYAKLSFDLNDDISVFNTYLKRYSHLDKGDRIYSYIAMAALHNHDYAAAVEAYDNIDELDDDMVSNYMKANYLRARQLINNGSYRKSIPCLKAAAYYSEKGSGFNQMSRYWLAESYYRNDQYSLAREEFMSLYNMSALYGNPESGLIPYNIAWCYFKEGNYQAALKWFDNYLSASSVKYRKEALERKGDCYFITKNYKSAASVYESVLRSYFNVNDIYPYYQAALSYGLANDGRKKIELLSNVMDASPAAEFYPEALFELGRSYALAEDDESAFKCFNTLSAVVKDSTFVARAYIEMGSLSRNQSQFNDALNYYKTVVEKMPLSGYAEDALLAIESIYQTKNEPEKYLDYIETIGKGSMKSADEREVMIFNSAEQIFLSENYQKALVSLQSYLDKYPAGRDAFKAYFYMAESYKNLGKYDQACDAYREVISGGYGSFVELSMLNFANLSYKLEKWDDAYGGYSSLYSSAQLENNKSAAVVGMMRSAYMMHDWNKALKNASIVSDDEKYDKATRLEADFIEAKAYLGISRRDEALRILSSLAGDPTTSYGAEAAYMLIMDSYDRGDFTEVENKVYDFSDKGSSHTYWLAKSFIVLGDSFVERGELEQAKATFESVRDGYVPEKEADDVMDNVNMRLGRLEKLLSEQNNVTE